VEIISFIEDEEVIKKILKHFGLWEVKARPSPKVKAPSVTIYLVDSESQVLSPDSFYVHPDYPMDSYLSWVDSGSCSDGWGKGLVCPQEWVKNSLLSVDEDEGPVFGHPHPTLKALCPGLPRMA